MPVKHTCDGENASPDISWQGAPAGTKSFVIIMEDRDIPARGLSLFAWVHWIVYDIPGNLTSLKEGIPLTASFENGMKQGKTSRRKAGYSGPNPPVGSHRYHFAIYAADILTGLRPEEATKRKILRKLEGHILARGEIVGEYGKRR